MSNTLRPYSLAHRTDHPTEAGYLYRGLRVLFISPGPSRVMKKGEAAV